MKIAITFLTTFTRLRRGTERFVHELARYLAGRGHEVRVIACKPGKREVIRRDGYIEDSHRRLWHPVLAKIGILEYHPFVLSTFRELLKERYDIVQCCSFTDALAAGVAGRLTGVPSVFLVNGLPPQIKYYRTLSLGGRAFRYAVRHSSEVIAISEYVQQYLRERFGRTGVRLPVPVDTELFALSPKGDCRRPVILSVSALDDSRKAGSLLMQAFSRLKDSCPDAVLQIAYTLPESVQERLLELVSPQWRADVRFLGTGSPEDLPRIYGRASVTVLPSLWETFGMVILESMATGTPVVGVRDSAIPELISDERVGRLFDPGVITSEMSSNVEGLTRAMVEGLELSSRPETAEACRNHAEIFSWKKVGPRFEELYEKVIRTKRIVRNGSVAALHGGTLL